MCGYCCQSDNPWSWSAHPGAFIRWLFSFYCCVFLVESSLDSIFHGIPRLACSWDGANRASFLGSCFDNRPQSHDLPDPSVVGCGCCAVEGELTAQDVVLPRLTQKSCGYGCWSGILLIDIPNDILCYFCLALLGAINEPFPELGNIVPHIALGEIMALTIPDNFF